MATEMVTIKKYEFSDGTNIHVKIDFENNRVSFVEPDMRKVDAPYRNKEWLFAERGVDYMNGWINILGAMQYVAREARNELEAWQKAQKDKKTKRIIDIMVALQEGKGDGSSN